MLFPFSVSSLKTIGACQNTAKLVVAKKVISSFAIAEAQSAGADKKEILEAIRQNE
jgi:hypothetical protein